ncbi:MAG: hypothetical protein ACYCZM_12010 [Acidimicrobiales bacterium]
MDTIRVRRCPLVTFTVGGGGACRSGQHQDNDEKDEQYCSNGSASRAV